VITLLADKNIPFLSDLLPNGVSLKLFDPDAGLPSFDESVDVLFIRTVTKINDSSLSLAQFPNLKLIGSASAGVDHVDINFLNNSDINFIYAAGCNANAVAEYVATGVLEWAISSDYLPSNLTVGVVGVGHTGTATTELLRAVGFSVILNDPPKEKVDPMFTGVTKSTILDADILSFHVPLIPLGEDFSTWHWLDSECISKMKTQLIVNASRGGVVDESALIAARSAGKKIDFILDVWENEPSVSPAVLKLSYLGTPHIAGYSQESKFNGTAMIVSELIHFFDLANDDHKIKSFEAMDAWTPNTQQSDIRGLHPMFGLSDQLKSGITDIEAENIKLFRKLRVHSSLRKEYRHVGSLDFPVGSPIQKILMVQGIK
jgi:erythronate-4-phosphate dehydrogenase